MSEQTEQTVTVTVSDAVKASNRDAVEIQQGACNPRALARALVKAVDAACDTGGSAKAGESPAVRLIVHQLLFILYRREIYLSSDGEWFPYDQYRKDLDYCEANQPGVKHETSEGQT